MTKTQQRGQSARTCTVQRLKPVTEGNMKTTPVTTDGDYSRKAVRTEVTCYNCRGTGHISRDCPGHQRPMKSSGCGSDEHRRMPCPNKATGSSETNTGRQLANLVDSTAVQHTKNHFTKTIMLNGTPVHGIVDTGIISVLIRDSVARRAGIAYKQVTCPYCIP